MKVLGIVCSPRKGGNTEILVREALEAVSEAGCETELVLIAGKKIAPCDGCTACLKDGICKIKDDMQMLSEQMEKADGVIFGTPVYFYNVTAQAKAVIDRTYPMAFHRKLRGKVAAAIVVGGSLGIGQVFGLMNTFFVAHGMVIAGASAGYGVDKGAVKEERPGFIYGGSPLREARSVGKNMVRLATRLEKGKG